MEECLVWVGDDGLIRIVKVYDICAEVEDSSVDEVGCVCMRFWCMVVRRARENVL